MDGQTCFLRNFLRKLKIKRKSNGVFKEFTFGILEETVKEEKTLKESVEGISKELLLKFLKKSMKE